MWPFLPYTEKTPNIFLKTDTKNFLTPNTGLYSPADPTYSNF